MRNVLTALAVPAVLSWLSTLVCLKFGVYAPAYALLAAGLALGTYLLLERK